LPEIGAIREVDLDDPPRDLRLDRHDLVGRALAHLVEVERRVARDRGLDGDGGRRPLERRLRLPVAGGERQDEESQQTEAPSPAGNPTTHRAHVSFHGYPWIRLTTGC
jgi:hypothetical protein